MSNISPPLWITKYEPTLEEIPQERIRTHLNSLESHGVNVLLHGPEGVGKSAAVTAFGESVHDTSDAAFIELNASDFFSLTKADLASHDVFKQFITPKRKRNSSKADLFNHVLKELAAYESVDGGYQTVVIDNAGSMRRDFQQALRRVIERHHDTTRFILVARSPSGIIPPIQSRCMSLPMNSPSFSAVTEILTDIAAVEDISHTPDAIEFLAGHADGNIRHAITALQRTAHRCDEVTHTTAYETVTSTVGDDSIESLWNAVESGDMAEAQTVLTTLLVDDGYDGEALLQQLHEDAQRHVGNDSVRDLAHTAADVDMQIRTGTTPRIHLMNYITDVAAEM